MSEVNEKYEQRILFEELDLNEHSIKENTPQIIVENNDWLVAADLDNEREERPVERRKPRWLWRGITGVFLTLVAVETTTFFIDGFAQSPIIASLYAALLAGLTITAGRALWRELSGMRQFRHQQQVQQQAQNILDGDSKIDAVALCEKITTELPCDLPELAYQQWHELNHQEYTEQELLKLYARTVLSKVDQKAIAEIGKFSTESVVLVALSPIAVVDMLIMLWRNLRMVNKIAALYGIKLGYWSRITLIKQVIVNMAYAGASELVADLGADLVGAELLGKLSARMAQGLGAGMLTARLGLKTIRLCRPLPFDNDAPKLAQVRQQIVSQVKALMVK